MRRTLIPYITTLPALGILLSGCSGSADPANSGAPSSTPSNSVSASPTGFAATASPEQIADSEAALKAYRKYVAAVTKARANPSKVPPELRKWSTDQALAGELAWLMTMEDQGIEFAGKPVIAPVVQDVDTKTKTVIITDCQDNSDWTPIDAKTGESRAAPGQSTNVWIDVEVRSMGGRWMVMKAKSDRSRSC